MKNRYKSNCNYCRQPVEAECGTLMRTQKAGCTFWKVICPDCLNGENQSRGDDAALRWSAGNAVSYGVVTSSGWRGMRNRSGRCEDAPCCGCCTF